MSVSTVNIGLQGYLQTFDITTTPQQLYSGLTATPGRYMLVFIQYGTTLLGGIDFILDGVSLNLIASYNFISITKGSVPFSLGLKDGSDTIFLDYQDGNILVSSTNNTIPFVSFKSFIIPTSYAGENIYSVDRITPNTEGKAITLDGNIETTTVTTGSVSFIDTTNVSSWSNTTSTARRIGKIVYISGTATLTVGINGILPDTPIDLISITPTNNFINTFPTIGTVIIKNGSSYSTGTIMNDTSSESAKIQLLIPESLTQNNIRDISFSLSYIVA